MYCRGRMEMNVFWVLLLCCATVFVSAAPLNTTTVTVTQEPPARRTFLDLFRGPKPGARQVDIEFNAQAEEPSDHEPTFEVLPMPKDGSKMEEESMPSLLMPGPVIFPESDLWEPQPEFNHTELFFTDDTTPKQIAAESPNETLIVPRDADANAEAPGHQDSSSSRSRSKDMHSRRQVRDTSGSAAPVKTAPPAPSVEVGIDEYDLTEAARRAHLATKETGETDNIRANDAEASKENAKAQKEGNETLEPVSPVAARLRHRDASADPKVVGAGESSSPVVEREPAGKTIRHFKHLDQEPKVPEWVWVVVAAVGGTAVLLSSVFYFRRRKSFERGVIADKVNVPIRVLTTPVAVV